MTAFESLEKAFRGDKSTETIKSGTLVTTRGTGVIAIALIGTFIFMDATGLQPWKDLSGESKLTFVLATGAIWAVVVAADSIARGIATASTRPTVVRLPTGIVAKYTTGEDSQWSVLAVEVSSQVPNGSSKYLVAKDNETKWVAGTELMFPQ